MYVCTSAHYKNGCLAGAALSCISRVIPVVTIGVWSLRNLPPQTTYLYPILIIAFFFFKINVIISTNTSYKYIKNNKGYIPGTEELRISGYKLKDYKDIVKTKEYKIKTNKNSYIWHNKHKLLKLYKYTPFETSIFLKEVLIFLF